MTRRETVLALLALGAAVRPLASFAQPQDKIWRIGVLSIGSVATARHLVDLGYQDARNVHYEVRYGEGSVEKFERYAREHVSTNVDLIWTSSTPATLAAQKATASIPIVFALVGDPIYSKVVRSLARPGANLTG